MTTWSCKVIREHCRTALRDVDSETRTRGHRTAPLGNALGSYTCKAVRRKEKWGQGDAGLQVWMTQSFPWKVLEPGRPFTGGPELRQEDQALLHVFKTPQGRGREVELWGSSFLPPQAMPSKVQSGTQSAVDIRSGGGPVTGAEGRVCAILAVIQHEVILNSY